MSLSGNKSDSWWQEQEELVAALESDLRALQSQANQQEDILAAEERRLRRTLEAQDVLQEAAKNVQEVAHQNIAKVVTTCLQTVFDDPYEFIINFERKRGKTEANLKFVRRGLVVDPLTASGGGMVDVAAFALRVSCLMLHRPKLSRVVVIDEGFKFVSAKYRDNVRNMLERLSEDLGLQIIQVTHIRELVLGKVIEL